MGDYHKMYTTNLKKQIKTNLFTKKGDRINYYIYRPTWIEKNGHEGLIDEVFNATKALNIAHLGECIYCVLNDITVTPKCVCGAPTSFIRFGKGYAEYCSVKCRANDVRWLNGVKATRKLKYGVEHIAQLPEEREKRSKKFKLIRPTFDMSNAPTKTRKTIDERYGVGFNTGWTDEGIKTRIKNLNMVSPEMRKEYRQYYNKVVYYTSKQSLTELVDYDKIGVVCDDNRNAYHVDHIYPIMLGFLHGVEISIINHISNLQCIKGLGNISKGNKVCDDAKNKLYERYGKWQEN